MLSINPNYSLTSRKSNSPPCVILEVDLVPQSQERKGTGVEKRYEYFYKNASTL